MTIADTTTADSEESDGQWCQVCQQPIIEPEVIELRSLNYPWQDKPTCLECCRSCSWCGSDDVEQWMAIDQAGDLICRGCREHDAYACDRCDSLVHCDFVVYIDNNSYDSRGWCEGCAERFAEWCDSCDTYHTEGCENAAGIHQYSYKPYPEFHHTPNDPDQDRNVYMGFELEVECGNSSRTRGDLADMVNDSLGNLVYLKDDGSLNHGFEIVTHPMTLAYAKHQNWDVFRELIREGVRSWNTDTCGLHVHVSRAGFTGRAHQYAFVLLLMRNRALSYVIAGRQGNAYARFDKDIREAVPRYLKGQGYIDRYSAVNVMPTATLEVRMFRGSLKVERVHAALEYVHAAVEYSRGAPKGASASADYLTAPAFIQWIRTRSELYPNLNLYIRRSAEFGYDRRADRTNRFTTTIETNEEVN